MQSFQSKAAYHAELERREREAIDLFTQQVAPAIDAAVRLSAATREMTARMRQFAAAIAHAIATR